MFERLTNNHFEHVIRDIDVNCNDLILFTSLVPARLINFYLHVQDLYTKFEKKTLLLAIMQEIFLSKSNKY